MPKNKNLSKITNYLTADTDNGILSSNVSQTITGSLTVTGNLTAQQFIVSSSVTYLTQSFASGSHKFGNSSDDTHQFTGSMLLTGSLTVTTTGTEFQVNAGGVNIGNALTDSHILSGSLRVNPNGLFVSSSGNVGIGTISPTNKLHITTNSGDGIKITTDDVTTLKMTISSGALKNWGFATNNTAASDFGIFQSTSNGGDPISAGTARLYFAAGGNTAIGYVGDAGYKLYVAGTIYATSTVTVAGQLITSAGQTGGYVAASSGYVNETQTVSTNGTSYYLYKSTGTSNGSSSTIFNITGMSTTNGTYADIYAVAQKDATASGINTNLEVQINGQYMVGIQAGGTSATTVRNAFRVCRMDGSWIIIGTVRT